MRIFCKYTVEQAIFLQCLLYKRFQNAKERIFLPCVALKLRWRIISRLEHFIATGVKFCQNNKTFQSVKYWKVLERKTAYPRGLAVERIIIIDQK